MAKRTIGVHQLRRSQGNPGKIDALTTQGIAKNIPENVVRCALGENDMNYLLRTDCYEGHCFGILMVEWEEWKQYGK